MRFKVNQPKTQIDLPKKRVDQSKKVLEEEQKRKEFKELYKKTYSSFWEFLEKIFSKAIINKYGRWNSGEYVKSAANFLQTNERTMYVGPRGHFKSVRFYAYIMWLIWRNYADRKSIRIYYLSYNDGLAAMHVNNIKMFVNNSIFTQMGLIDLDSTAKSQALYTWWDDSKTRERQPLIEIKSYGIMGGLRGGHCEYLFVDDPYQDPDTQQSTGLEPLIVTKINDIFDAKVLPIPVPGGELHVIGTPQSWTDIWFQDRFDKSKVEDCPKNLLTFSIRIEKAYQYKEVDGEMVKCALFPEMYPLAWLESQESIAPSKFKQEYLCQPRVASDSFFDLGRIQDSTDPSLDNYDFSIADMPHYNYLKYKGTVYAAYDPGKSIHPGHFIVVRQDGGTLVQLLSKWFDSWDYAYTTPDKKSQLKYIEEAVDIFNIEKIWADNTNGVLTQTIERNDLPQMVEVKISKGTRNSFATELERFIGGSRIRFIQDERQQNAFLAIQSDLRTLETRTGDMRNHGESFTTWGMMVVNTIGKSNSGIFRVARKHTTRDQIMNYYRGYF